MNVVSAASGPGAIGYRPVGFNLDKPVFARSVLFEFVPVEIILIDDPAHIGNRTIVVRDTGYTENGIVESRRFDNGRLQVAVPDNIIDHGSVERKIIRER